MKEFLKNRWVLLVVLAVFITIKIPHLSYPYYWDESTPYAVAIRAMHDNGLSLRPTAIHEDLSRGHPLFFHLVAAFWMKCFGVSWVAMHSFALLISVLFLVAIYEAALRLFNVRTAVLALLLIVAQEAFLVQSSFVLPEILVGFLCFLSIWSYVMERHILVAIFLTMLFFTKESGMIMGIVLGIDALLKFFRKTEDRKQVIYRLLSVAIPCLLIGMFFLLQKQVRGWYFYPLHSGMIEKNWGDYWYKFRMSAVFLTFYINFRYWYLLVLVLIATLAAWKSRQYRLLVLLLPAILIYFMVDNSRAAGFLPPVFFAPVFVLSWLVTVRVLCHAHLFPAIQQRRFVALAAAFIFCYFCFSSSNFLTYRYMLCSIVIVLFLAAVIMERAIAYSYNVLYYLSIAGFAVICYFALTLNKDHFGDTELGAYNALAVQRDLVAFLEDRGDYEKKIAANHLVQEQLCNPAVGSLRSARKFKDVKWDIDNNTQIVIFDYMEGIDDRYKMFSPETATSRYRLLRRFQKGNVWSELYELK